MSKGRVLFALVALGSAAFIWRRRQRGRDQVDLYYADGSMISLSSEASEAQQLLSLANAIAGAAKPG